MGALEPVGSTQIVWHSKWRRRILNSSSQFLFALLILAACGEPAGTGGSTTPEPSPEGGVTSAPSKKVAPETHSLTAPAVGAAVQLNGGVYRFSWSVKPRRDSNGNIIACNWKAGLQGVSGFFLNLHDGYLSAVEPMSAGYVEPERIGPGDYRMIAQTDCESWTFSLTAISSQ